tara:strand:- start:319 stop:588 length:270 start_codon:yes stop_codon:yes gene_type:complete
MIAQGIIAVFFLIYYLKVKWKRKNLRCNSPMKTLALYAIHCSAALATGVILLLDIYFSLSLLSGLLILIVVFFLELIWLLVNSRPRKCP